VGGGGRGIMVLLPASPPPLSHVTPSGRSLSATAGPRGSKHYS
jgi:hypothetical protein